MPMISTKTNVAISAEQEIDLKSRLGEAIAVLSGKSENWLMLDFQDNCRLWFQGDNSAPIAYIEVKVYGRIDYSQSNKLTAKLCKIFNEVMSISPDRIYVKYEEVDMWGYDGSNF